MRVFEALWNRLAFPVSYLRHDSSTEKLFTLANAVESTPPTVLPATRPKSRSRILLPLPLEIVSIIVAFAVSGDVSGDVKTFVSLSTSSRFLRSQACKRYFDDQGLIMRPKGTSNTTVLLHDTQPLVVAGLLLTYDALMDGRDIALEADVFYLMRLREEFCSMLASCTVSSVRIAITSGHSQDYLTHDPALSTAFIAMLASLRSTFTLDITTKKPNGPNYNHKDLPLRCREPNVADDMHTKALCAMDKATIIDISSPRFCVPSLVQVYPYFLRGASIVVLSLTCESMVKLLRALAVVNCPALEEVWLTTLDATSILLPNNFLNLHPNITRCMLINRPSGNMPVRESNPKPELFLPQVTTAGIYANYSSIRFESMEVLSEFIIRPLHPHWTPHDEAYCHEVTSPCVLLSASQQNTQYPNGCCISIFLPFQLVHHVRYRQQHHTPFHCRCTPERSERVLNVFGLQVVVDHLDLDVFMFLSEWVAWFPALRILYIRTDPDDIQNWTPSYSDLHILTSTCPQLSSFHWGPLYSPEDIRGWELAPGCRWVECQANP